MHRRLLSILVGICAVGFSDAALADWTVVRATGTTWIVAPDSTARAPVQGEVVPNAWMVATGPNGRVLLMRNDETISIAPGTQLVLTERGPVTQVYQPAGTVEFDVEVRAFRHFVVQTPVLAAVVKGTRFVVSVVGMGAGVRVERGAVEVEGYGTGEIALVGPGQEAEVDNLTANLEVRGEGELPQIHIGRPLFAAINANGNGGNNGNGPGQNNPNGPAANNGNGPGGNNGNGPGANNGNGPGGNNGNGPGDNNGNGPGGDSGSDSD